MVRMLVTCSGDDKNRFDREYYANTHLALTLNCWGPDGLLAVSAFFPPVAHGKSLLPIGVYDFRDEPAMHAALAAPEMVDVIADVANFTDTTAIERSV